MFTWICHSLENERLTHLPWFNICASHTIQLVYHPPPSPFGKKIVGNVQIANSFFSELQQLFSVCCGLSYKALWLVKQYRATFSTNQVRPILTWLHEFSRASRLLGKLNSKADWIICNIVYECYVWRVLPFGTGVSTLKGAPKIFMHLHRYPPSLARASTLSRARLFAISCKTKYTQMWVV